MPRPSTCAASAEWTGRSIDEIQALNPELRRWTTPVESELRAEGAGRDRDALQGAAGTASPDELVALKWYTVKKGETIATIARKLKVSRVDLAEANHLSTRSKIKVGQALVVPRAPATLLATNSRPAAPSAVASRGLSGAAPMADDTPRAARRGAARGQGREQRRQDRHLPRQARRHALWDRAALRHHRGQDQEPEPAAVQPITGTRLNARAASRSRASTLGRNYSLSR